MCTRAPARPSGASLLSLAALVLLVPALAHAEGSADLPQVDFLLPESEVFVDVLDAASEVIQYSGDAPVDVYRPDGSLLGTFQSGAVIDPDRAGAWRFDWGTRVGSWDIEVPSRTGGRVWSPDWRLDASTFGPSGALSRSFYARVNGGSDSRDGVIELKVEGLAGYVYRVEASSLGLASSPGRSVPDLGQGYRGRIPIYLRAPQDSSHNPLSPTVQKVAFSVDAGDCDAMATGLYDGVFSFETNVDGRYHLTCDLNGDGTFDLSSDDDLHLTGEATAGMNSVVFDGVDQLGATLPPGSYDCRVTVTVGELHVVLRDIETLYAGLRLFEYQGGTVRRGLSMLWNDQAVADGDVLLPNGQASLESSGPAGVASGAYADATTPNTNSRAWGNFTGASKGNGSWMDTWTWIGAVNSGAIAIEVVDGTVDGDGDTLFDVAESCVTGTDPLLADSDDDGLRDDVEVSVSPSDPLNPDSDGDCLLDGAESTETGTSGDYDGDGLADSLDDDDDGDGITTQVESCDRPAGEYPADTLPQDYDLDNDGHPNHMDRDVDGDHHADAVEGLGDGDFDGIPAWLDADEIGIGSDGTGGYFGGGCATPGSSTGAVAALGALLLARRRRRPS